jgi:hypothetical protein
VNTKAGYVVNAAATIAEVLGPERHREFLARLPEATRILHTKKMLAIAWVPSADWARTYDVLWEYLGHDRIAFVRFARAIFARNFSTIYKFLLSFTSTEFVAHRIAKAWPTFNDWGEMRISVVHKDGEHELTLACTQFIDCPPFLYVFQGYVEQCLDMTKSRLVAWQTVDSVRKNGHLEFTLRCTYR